MNRNEAIKELEALKILEGAKFMPYTCDALLLGIEALKRLQQHSDGAGATSPGYLLPGEAKGRR